MSNATAPRLSSADQAAALADTHAHALTPAERAFFIEHVIETAKVKKMSVSKLTKKVTDAILEQAWAEANTSDIEGVADVIELRPAATRVRGSHEGCTHEANKVARAKCRRDRARNA